MPGPKPKPTALRVVDGTLFQGAHGRTGRQLNEPAPEPGIGDPPPHLSPSQVAIWEQLRADSPAGLLTRVDRGIFEGYCVLLSARIEAIKGFNKTEKPLTPDRDKVLTSNPHLREVRRLTEQLRALDGELGYSPAARSRIHIPEAAEDDPLAGFLGAGKSRQA